MPALRSLHSTNRSLALDTALTALQRDLPDDAQAQHLYGVAQMRLKRTQLAEPALKLAVEKAPKDWQMRIDLADLLMQLGRNAEALELLKLKTTDSPAPQFLVRTPWPNVSSGLASWMLRNSV